MFDRRSAPHWLALITVSPRPMEPWNLALKTMICFCRRDRRIAGCLRPHLAESILVARSWPAPLFWRQC